MNRFVSLLIGLACVTPAIAQQLAQPPQLEALIQTGHSDDIPSMAVSAGGKWIVTGGSDKRAILWDGKTGQMLRVFDGHDASVQGVAISKDGSRILTAALDNVTILWEAATGRRITTFGRNNRDEPLNGGNYSVIFSPDERRIFTATVDKVAIQWDAVTGEKLRTYVGHKDPVCGLAVSADGKRLATSGFDGKAILWDTASGQILKTFTGSSDFMDAVGLNADGSRLLTGNPDEAILWDTATGQKLHTFRGNASRVQLSDDGKLALAGSFDKPAVLWDTTSGKKLQSFAGETTIGSLAMSPDNKYVGVASGSTVYLYEAATGTKLQTLAGRTTGGSAVALSKDGKQLVANLAGGGACAASWDLEMGHRSRLFTGYESSHSVVLSADGKRLVCATNEYTKDAIQGIAVVFDATTGQKLHAFQADTGGIARVAISPDGSMLAAELSSKNQISLWDISTGKVRHTFTDTLFGADFSKDGTQLIVGGRRHEANIYDTATGKLLQTLKGGHTNQVNSVLLPLTGKYAYTGSADGTIVMWEAATGRKSFTFKQHDSHVFSLNMASDRSYLVTGSWDRTAALWDMNTGKKARSFVGHTDFVTAADMSPDRKYVVTGSSDATIRFWDAETGQELARLINFDAGKEWLVVTPEGYFDGSINGAQFLSYRVAGTLDFVPLDRYQHRYHKPGLLAMLLKGERPRPNVPIAQALPPRVRIVEPMKSGTMDVGTLQITAVAESVGQQPVTSLRLILDERPFQGQKGIYRVPEPKAGEARASWSISLDPGKHKIKVLADTDLTQGFSEEIEIIRPDPAAEVVLPSLYVLSVGVSKYPGSLSLNYAHKDAQELAKAYEKHGAGLYRKVEVKVITDEEATRKNILGGLTWLRQSMTTRDFGVFFFAGHGEKDNDGSLFFLPIDVDTKDLSATAISGEDLKRSLNSIPGRLTSILDACHAGGIDGEKRRGGRTVTDDLIRDLIAEENGLVVLCSATGREFALESNEHRQGMFTLALLEGLAGQADANKDGTVYLHELESYVLERVKVLSQGRQHPVTGKPTTVRSFPITRPKS